MTVEHSEISIERRSAGDTVTERYDYAGCAHADVMLHNLLSRTEDVAGGTVVSYAKSFGLLAEFLSSQAEGTLSARSYRAFAQWLREERSKSGGPRFGPDTRDQTLGAVLSLYEHGASAGHRDWSIKELDSMKYVRESAQRGRMREADLNSIDRAVSIAEYEGFLHALRLEHEAVREALSVLRASGKPIPNGRPDPDPYVVLCCYAALLHGVRADELNVLELGDVDVKRKSLRCHAPNKPEREIPVDDLFLETFANVLAWGLPARELSGSDAVLVYIATVPRRAVVRVTSTNLHHRTLPAFYAKYHRLLVDGRPVLHTEGDPHSPFYSDYRKLRNAALARWAEREGNLALVQARAGHARQSTTKRHYLHLHRLDMSRKLARALGPEAQIIAAGSRNPIGQGTPAEVAELAARGAVTTFGGCAADSCKRASHCFDCDLAIYQVSKRANIESELGSQARRADALEAQGFVRDAENARRLAAAAKAQLLRIDDFVRRSGGDVS